MRGILNNIEQKHVPANYWSTLHKKWKWKKAEDNVYISIRKMSLSLTEKKNIFRIHPQHVSLPIILYIILFLVGYFVWFFFVFLQLHLEYEQHNDQSWKKNTGSARSRTIYPINMGFHIILSVYLLYRSFDCYIRKTMKY